MAKELRKAIKNRSKLRNKFLKTRNEELKDVLIAKEISVSLLRKTKKRVFFCFFFWKLDHRGISDNRRFWKTVGPFFS